MSKLTTEDRALVKRMEEIRDLLSEFGLALHGYDPGVTAFLKNTPGARGGGWAGEPISLCRDEWKWLEPLLAELREYRRAAAFRALFHEPSGRHPRKDKP